MLESLGILTSSTEQLEVPRDICKCCREDIDRGRLTPELQEPKSPDQSPCHFHLVQGMQYARCDRTVFL